MRLVLLGPPGAGKGTLSEGLVKRYGCEHISTGDIFREHRQKQTDFGKLLASYIDKGSFVPDDIVLQIVGDHLRNMAGDSFILDGFPRTLAQAEALEKMLADLKRGLDGVVCLNVSTELLVARLSQRRICPKCNAVYHLINRPPQVMGICDNDGIPIHFREDDHEEVIVERMKLYERNTAPLIDFYEKCGLLMSFDGSGTPEQVEQSVFAKLDSLGK